MAIGKQGGKGTAPVGKPIMGMKAGGKVVGGGKKTLGKWLESDEPSAPPVKAVRKLPSFNTGPKKKK